MACELKVQGVPVEYIIYNNNYIINASNNDIMKRDGNTVFSASAVSDRVAVTKGKKPYNLSIK